MSEEIKSDDFEKAMDNIARTHDGVVLYRYLQKVRMGITPADMSECALRANEGRRSFAADLMAHMGKGIRDSGRNADSIVTFAVAGARAISGPSGSGRIRAYLAEQSKSDAKPDASAG